jgi:hypothetical protein
MKRIEIKSKLGTFITLDDVAEKIGNWGWHTGTKGDIRAHLRGSRKGYRRWVSLSHMVILIKTGRGVPEG